MKVLLKLINKKYKWIAATKEYITGIHYYVYTHKPIKKDSGYFPYLSNNSEMKEISEDLFNVDLSFLKYTDEEPTLIEDLLKEKETMKSNNYKTRKFIADVIEFFVDEETVERIYNNWIKAKEDGLLDFLTDREQLVIEEYYFKGKTLEEVGKEVGVNKERIRQNVICAERKLNHPSGARMSVLFYGRDFLDIERKVAEKKNELNKVYEDIDREIMKAKKCNIEIKDVLEKNGINVGRLKTPLYSESIDLLDFSVRTYNCLHRSGIDTINQLLNMPYEKLVRVRNLGRKSIKEVALTLIEKNYATRETLRLKGYDL